MKKVYLIKCSKCQYIGYVKEFWVDYEKNGDCEKVFRCPACKEKEPKFICKEVEK